MESAVAAHAAAQERAIAMVKKARPYRSVSEIEVALADELRARGGYMPPDEVRLIALQIADPAWAVRHPRQWNRLVRGADSGARREVSVMEEVDRTMARLEAVVNSLRGLRRSSITAHRTMDGVEYEVSIDPWTAGRARKLRRRSGPLLIKVRSYT